MHGRATFATFMMSTLGGVFVALASADENPLQIGPKDMAPPVVSSDFDPLPADLELPDPSVAALPCGPVVYENAYNGSGSYAATGAGLRIADDCRLVGSERGICGISSNVFNSGAAGNTVTLEVWDGCPQAGGTLIASSPAFPLPGTAIGLVTWNFSPIVPAGNRIWIAWKSPVGGVGPLISEFAEVGYTADQFGSDNCGGGGPACTCFFGGVPYAGFDVTISAVEVPSACCLPDDSCVDLLSGDCAAANGTSYVGAYCDTFTCPPHCPSDTLFGQSVVAPTGAWTAYTSDQDAGYLVFDNFSGLTDPICDVHFWGFQGFYSGGWTYCAEDPMDFEIKFYQNAAGTPGAEVCSHMVTLSGTDTGLVYPGAINWTLFEYSATFNSCCNLTDGWISIQAVGGASCWFLWPNSYGLGDGGFQFDGVNLLPVAGDLAFCLTGASITLEPDDTCYAPGSTVTVEVAMTDVDQVIHGGQFFLDYDASKLQLVSADPGDAPFTLEVFECSTVDSVPPGCVSTIGEIDYAVGVPFGDPGSSANTVMARLTFLALAEVCQTPDLVSFRPHDPPTRLTGPLGSEVLPVTLNLPSVSIDGAAPVISGPTVVGGDVDGNCERTVTFSATVTDNCCVTAADVAVGVTLPTANATLSNIVIDKLQVSTTEVSISGSALVSDLVTCPATLQVTIDAVDCCGNVAAQAVETADVNDATDPVITCPADLSVNADAGTCEAALAVGTATATDNCDPAPVITWVRSDGKTDLSDPYEAVHSPITITWTATDCAGNTDVCVQTITVSAYNELVVDLDLSPTVTGPFLRCITFELWACPGAAPVASVDVDVSFDGAGSANGVIVLVPCTSAPYTCVTARDKLHTLRRTLDPLPLVGTQYIADFAAAGKDLIGGNLNDDFWIDILDFGVFSSQFSTNYGTPDSTCGTAYPHADISGNGLVNTGDFTFIQINFLMSHEANCCGALGRPEGGDGPVREISVADLRAMGMSALSAGDLNGDGWLDESDIVEFLAGVRPTPGAQPTPTDVDHQESEALERARPRP